MGSEWWQRNAIRIGVGLAIALSACQSDHQAQEPTPAVSPVANMTGRVDVGGYELAWTCEGSGSPTILAEAGYDSTGTSTFLDLMEPLSEIARVCTYDRAGTGTSDNRLAGLHVTSLLEAKELHALLEGAAIAPPYVVVAHSYGGFIGRLFAATYPTETAGLALIDSSHEDEIGPYRRYYGNSPEGDWVDGGDLIDIDATRRELRSSARDYGDMPLAVVKAGIYEDVLTIALWDRTQADLATLSANAVLIQAAGGHFVMDDDPVVLLAAVRAVVASARSGDALPICRDVVTGTDGRCP
jgi:pimeloyl-ACP methyl ester carboxylesterase